MMVPARRALRALALSMSILLAAGTLTACDSTDVADPEPEAEVEAPAEDSASEDASDEASSAADETAAEAEDMPGSLVLYSGRSESLVGPIIERFEMETGIEVEARWGSTPEMVATLQEEGEASPADLFFAQDPGGLGAVADRMARLPDDLVNRVDPRFRDPQGRWVGISGRARVLVYNSNNVDPAELPDSLEGLIDPQWVGRIGWAPTNSSYQTMLTAQRSLDGEDAAKDWLTRFLALEPVAYEKNSPTVEAVGAGEVDLGLVNHYYLYRFLAEEGKDFAARNHFLSDGGAGSLVMVAGAGLLETAANPEPALRFLEFMLSPAAQQYFAEETYEYPLIDDPSVQPAPELPSLADLNVPEIGLGQLADLEGSAALLQEVGALP